MPRLMVQKLIVVMIFRVILCDKENDYKDRGEMLHRNGFIHFLKKLMRN